MSNAVTYPNALAAVLGRLKEVAGDYQQIVGFSDEVIEDLLGRSRATPDVVAVFVGSIEDALDTEYEGAKYGDKVRRFSILFRTRAIPNAIEAYSQYDSVADAFSGTTWRDNENNQHTFFLAPVTVIHGGQYSGAELNIESV